MDFDLKVVFIFHIDTESFEISNLVGKVYIVYKAHLKVYGALVFHGPEEYLPYPTALGSELTKFDPLGPMGI